MSRKYPRTPHLPYSGKVSSDDKVLSSTGHFVGSEVVVTCKLDGECSGLTQDSCHARSLDSRDHPSRHWLKKLHGQIRHDIPAGWEIYGENMYAKHAIFYDNLTTYFYVFGIVNEAGQFLSWEEMKEFATLLGLETVPVLWRGIWDEKQVKDCFPGNNVFSEKQEGYVVRMTKSFPYDEFHNHVAKFVSADFTAGIGDVHWQSASVVPNLLWSAGRPSVIPKKS